MGFIARTEIYINFTSSGIFIHSYPCSPMTSARSMLHPEYRATRSRVVGCVIGYISIRNTTVYYFHFILHLNLVHDVHCVPPYTKIYINFTEYIIMVHPCPYNPVTKPRSMLPPNHRSVIGYIIRNRKVYYFHCTVLCNKFVALYQGVYRNVKMNFKSTSK
jgi:hypothetical protein